MGSTLVRGGLRGEAEGRETQDYAFSGYALHPLSRGSGLGGWGKSARFCGLGTR